MHTDEDVNPCEGASLEQYKGTTILTLFKTIYVKIFTNFRSKTLTFH